MITPQPVQDYFNPEHALVCTLAEQISPTMDFFHHISQQTASLISYLQGCAGEAIPVLAEITTSSEIFATVSEKPCQTVSFPEDLIVKQTMQQFGKIEMQKEEEVMDSHQTH